VNSQADSPNLISYYDSSPLKTTLAKLVDFDLINSKPMRFSAGATNVRTGASTYFDNGERTITFRMSWRAHRCHRDFRRPRLMASIIGMAPSFRIHPCNSLSTIGGATAHLSSKSIFGTRTAKCRSTFRRPSYERRKSTALAALTSQSNNTKSAKISARVVQLFGSTARRLSRRP